MTPTVSVCVPLYQKAAFVGRTIESVLASTHGDLELVVIDNASTDGSDRVVAGFDDPRLRVITNEATVPMVENFALAVAHARAPLVKVVCADDLLEPTALARQVAVLEADPEVVVVSSRHHVIDDHDAVLSRDRTLRTPDLVGRHGRADVVRRIIRHGGNPTGNLANMTFRRSAFDAVGGFLEGDAYVLDVALVARLTTVGHFHGIPETLARFRLAAGGDSGEARHRFLRAQRAFTRGLRRDHADVVRWRDVAAGEARWPLTYLRHQALMRASSDSDSVVHRVASLALR